MTTMMKTIRTLMVAVCCLWLAGCLTQSKRLEQERVQALKTLTQSLTNQDVQWDGTYVGLQPHLSPRAERILREADVAIPLLRAAVKHTNQYVVAHVLLTRMTMKFYHFDAQQWNGLQVSITPENVVSYGDHAPADIRKLWANSGSRPFSENSF